MTARTTKRLANRKFRAQTGEFLAEGPQAVREALAFGAAIEVFATPKYDDWTSSDVVWNVIDEATLAEIADSVTPQGIVARCRSIVGTLADLPAAARFVVLCEDMRDPGNAGSVIRAADAAGADAVILVGESVDPLNPKAVRASAGSHFHLPILVERDLDATLELLRGRGLQVLAADGRGDVDLFDAPLSEPTAWILGNEAHGLSDGARRVADAVVAVPIYGRAESLNLATAAAVVLYASARALRTD